jgi:hypothetical protein
VLLTSLVDGTDSLIVLTTIHSPTPHNPHGGAVVAETASVESLTPWSAT